MKFPKNLKKGDTIGIIAPASPYKAKSKDSLNYELYKIREKIESFGYKVKMGNTCYLSYKGYLAGDDDKRVKDIEDMFKDKDVDGILCLRGGYGTPRILDKINYDIIKENPKVFIGYSDITALHIAFNQICDLVTYHGIMASTSPNWHEFTYNSFKNMIDMKESLNIENPPEEELYTLVGGIAEGIITGGNLSLITSAMGTKYEIDTKGKILFIEEVGEPTYKIDRMLKQLELGGKFEDCIGIIFGDFKDCNKEDDDDYELYDLLLDTIKDYNKPCVYNLQSGHCNPMISIPLGVNCKLDATNKSIILNS
ncbi:LD-carboxypeptidase [Paraclostridium ghonii]|uniref:Muramoyltetrapeptide carboxypeptidase n=1 Tax=Paraclostridium ghonii TaxID=29358 RepID=A0ABU0MX17_9FIRM|nr:LD-carboxypeptidase [Paeniclostridium ghonii]MDQ0555451.1 muramoyltetrapeptide carboxypeptidase [Paeniclostridium ghonii]